MVKPHKDFGEWKSTTIINNNLVVRRFKLGYEIKNRKDNTTEEITCPEGTTREGEAAVVSRYK